MAIYADDALLFNSSFQEHKKLLRTVLQKMKDKSLRKNPRKSKFATDRAVYVGFELSAHGLRIDPKRFQKIRDLQPATNVKQVKILCGFANYFRRHVPRYAVITSPIRDLLRRDVPFHWGERQDKALEQLKEALLNNAMLIYPDMNEKFCLQSESSSKAIAHCLLQMKDGILRPILFGGRALKKHETKMSATDLELVGFLDAILSYKQLISNGKRWTILTDHLSLQYIQDLRHSALPKVFRYSLLLQDLVLMWNI
jgi:hypothetical protein